MGTFVFASTVLASTQMLEDIKWIALLISIGLFVSIIIASGYSSAALNPAIVLALVLRGDLKPIQSVVYVAGQLVGVVAAWFSARLVVGYTTIPK